jgi:hypothetical protein
VPHYQCAALGLVSVGLTYRYLTARTPAAAITDEANQWNARINRLAVLRNGRAKGTLDERPPTEADYCSGLSDLWEGG